MKTTVEYLDAIKSRLNLPSDYAIAKALGLTRAAVSKQRLGHSVFDDTTALRVAEILDVDPMEVIAAANAERARDEATRRLWERAWGKVTGATVAVALTMGAGLSAAPSVAESATTARFMHEFTLCQIADVGPHRTSRTRWFA